MIGPEPRDPSREELLYWAPRISGLFISFIDGHCRKATGAYVHIDTLHAAFMDYCIGAGHDVKWVNAFVALKCRTITLPLSLAAGGMRKGSNGNVIISGIELVSYP